MCFPYGGLLRAGVTALSHRRGVASVSAPCPTPASTPASQRPLTARVAAAWRRQVRAIVESAVQSSKEQERLARAAEHRRQVGMCIDILGLFKRGVLVLDEVDLLLHPLRSELNWPLGGKVPPAAAAASPPSDRLAAAA